MTATASRSNLLELASPLLDQMRRAKHGEALDFAAVNQLTKIRPASIVLPMPTSSAISSRTVGRRSAMSSGTS